MKEFHPFLDLSGHSPEVIRRRKAAGARVDDERVALTLGFASFYSAVSRQLYNHVIQRAQFRECANETCNQIFVRQVRGGVAKYSPNQEGVKFCSRSCARAQAQRQYRRRKRAKEGSN
jgi:hypothetical protein